MRKVSVIAAALVLGAALTLGAMGASGQTRSNRHHTSNSVSGIRSWLNYGGDLANSRYSTLTQIDPSNVGTLQLAWTGLFDSGPSSGGENSPIVVGNTLYTSNGATMAAFNATTGQQLWEKTNADRNQKPTVLSISPGVAVSTTGAANRGQAYGDGMLFGEESDGTMVGFNAYTGLPVWQTLLNPKGFHGYSPPAPLYYKGLVYVGLSGSDSTTGLHATYTALNAKTGAIVWQFNITPQPSGPGSDTWGNPAELANGGGANWVVGTIDPKLGLVYVPTGNPYPDFGRTQGDDDFTDGVLALDLQTGKLKWFYQTTHHDEWDYDCTMPAALWNQTINGQMVYGLELACKNGYVYELNRETGQPITPVKEEPIANATTDSAAATLMTNTYHWLRTGGKPLTEPIPVGAGAVTQHCATAALLPGPAPDGQPYEYSCAFNYYSADHYVAGTNQDSVDWQPMSVDQKLGYAYICANNGIRAVKMGDPNAPQTADAEVWPQLLQNGDGGSEPRLGWFTALNLRNNQMVWRKEYPSSVCAAGSAATASGIVFGVGTASTGGSTLYAYDASNGNQISTWTEPGLTISGPPIIFEESGKEYVAFEGTVINSANVPRAEILALALP
jgi:alcohol dehydrogenase (cytochrome c)